MAQITNRSPALATGSFEMRMRVLHTVLIESFRPEERAEAAALLAADVISAGTVNPVKAQRTRRCIVFKAYFEDDEGFSWDWFGSIEDAEKWIKRQAYYIDADNEFEWWPEDPPANLLHRERVVSFWRGQFQADDENEPVFLRAWIENLQG